MKERRGLRDLFKLFKTWSTKHYSMIASSILKADQLRHTHIHTHPNGVGNIYSQATQIS